MGVKSRLKRERQQRQQGPGLIVWDSISPAASMSYVTTPADHTAAYAHADAVHTLELSDRSHVAELRSFVARVSGARLLERGNKVAIEYRGTEVGTYPRNATARHVLRDLQKAFMSEVRGILAGRGFLVDTYDRGCNLLAKAPAGLVCAGIPWRDEPGRGLDWGRASLSLRPPRGDVEWLFDVPADAVAVVGAFERAWSHAGGRHPDDEGDLFA